MCILTQAIPCQINFLHCSADRLSSPAFNRGDDGIAGNDDKDDDEAIDDDYYCFICLLGNAWSALPYATCCIFIFRPDGGTLVELQDINSLDSYTCNFRLILKQMDKKT